MKPTQAEEFITARDAAIKALEPCSMMGGRWIGDGSGLVFDDGSKALGVDDGAPWPGNMVVVPTTKQHVERDYERVAHAGVAPATPYRSTDTRFIPRAAQNRVAREYRARCVEEDARASYR